MSIAVIIPTLNEAENLRRVLSDLAEAGIPRSSVIVVDGGSTDCTREMAYGTRFMRQNRTGKGNAIVMGMERALWSGVDIVVMMDADGSHSAEDVWSLVHAVDEHNAEFVKGSRFLEGGGSVDFTVVRRAGAWALNRWFDFRFGVKNTDLCYGLMAFKASALDRLIKRLPSLAGNEPRQGDGFEIETLINCAAAQLRLTTVEVASIERHRIHGESHLRPVQDGLRVLRTIERERKNVQHFTTPRGYGADYRAKTDTLLTGWNRAHGNTMSDDEHQGGVA